MRNVDVCIIFCVGSYVLDCVCKLIHEPCLDIVCCNHALDFDQVCLCMVMT